MFCDAQSKAVRSVEFRIDVGAIEWLIGFGAAHDLYIAYVDKSNPFEAVR